MTNTAAVSRTDDADRSAPAPGSEAASDLLAACPLLATLPEFRHLDPEQALAIWQRMTALPDRPRVLELGQGPWAGTLALMTRTLAGSFTSLGLDAGQNGRLQKRLKDTGISRDIHVRTTSLVDTELLGTPGHFPDLDVLEGSRDFNLAWISSAPLFETAEQAVHSLPAIASHMDPDGFDFMLEGQDAESQQSIAAQWQALAGEGLQASCGSCHGIGLWVSASGDLEQQREATGYHRALAAHELRQALADSGVATQPLPRPELTFPEQEALEVTRQYARASVILEYGSGGSTVLAAELPGKKVISVESDPKWLCRLNNYLDATPAPSRPITYYVDIGPTKEWGYPVNLAARAKFPNYSAGVWLEDFFEHPDLVLVDGRFRVACFLACAALTQRPLTVLFDDYVDRPHYHCVETVCAPVRIVGRMAIFEIEPGAFHRGHLALLEDMLHTQG